MADFNEQNIKFGWLTKPEMLVAIQNGDLDAYDVCFTKDTHEQFLISSTLEPISIKSRLRIYGSVDSAIADINETTETYVGEILCVRDDSKFISYIVNQFDDGKYFISPICSDGQVDYNDLQNAPIKNLDGTVTNPVIIADLDTGHYKITGHFITPSGTEVTSIVGNYFIVEQESVNTKVIKRISTKSVIDYTIKDGNVTANKYATEKYIKDQGFVDKAYLDEALEAFRIATEKYIHDYVEVTCTLLIKHIIDDELNLRYAKKEDIEELFE